VARKGVVVWGARTGPGGRPAVLPDGGGSRSSIP